MYLLNLNPPPHCPPPAPPPPLPHHPRPCQVKGNYWMFSLVPHSTCCCPALSLFCRIEGGGVTPPSPSLPADMENLGVKKYSFRFLPPGSDVPCPEYFSTLPSLILGLDRFERSKAACVVQTIGIWSSSILETITQPKNSTSADFTCTNRPEWQCSDRKSKNGTAMGRILKIIFSYIPNLGAQKRKPL